MAATIPPKTENNPSVTDKGSSQGSKNGGPLSPELCNIIYELREKAIAKDKRKRLLKATLNIFEQQIADGTIRKN